MSESYSKSVYGKQLEMCYNWTCSQLRDLTLELHKVNNNQMLSAEGKKVQCSEINDKISTIKQTAFTRIEEYCTAYKKRLDEYISNIGGKHIDKDDMFLLQSTIVMKQEEFSALALKHKNNYWMMRALSDYADIINNSPENKTIIRDIIESGYNAVGESKILSLPYKVYSFDEKRKKADQAANGHILFIEEASYNDISNEYGSFAYTTYLITKGYSKLDEICCE